MSLSFNLSSLLEPSLFSDGSWARYIFYGAGVTITLTVLPFLTALFLGAIIGTLRTSASQTLRILSEAWIELFRNIPLLVQIFIWYFVVPEILPPFKDWLIRVDPFIGQFFCAYICLSLFTSSRIAEQFRAGISSIPKGQFLACSALGLTRFQAYRYVILPIAVRHVLPPLTSEAMNLVKNTAIAITIGLADITLRANEMGENTFEYFAAYLWATILYVVISYTVGYIMRKIEHHSRIPGLINSRS